MCHFAEGCVGCGLGLAAKPPGKIPVLCLGSPLELLSPTEAFAPAEEHQAETSSMAMLETS